MLELRFDTSVVSAPSAFDGQLEACPGAGRRLVEQQRDPPLGQDVVAHDGVLVLQLGGAHEQPAHAVHGQVENREQRTRDCRETAMRARAEW